MASGTPLAQADFKRLQGLGTCDVSNAIERFSVRMRNEGFADGSIRCVFPEFPPLLGYAVPCRVHTSSPPISGRYYHMNFDWWRYVATIPAPRVLVFHDVDENPGRAALAGELHGAIGKALDCVGLVTNGAVRDLPQFRAMGFHVFASAVVVSHSYAHIADFGKPVEINGFKITPGDLIHGDRHGVHTIPLSIGTELPDMVENVLLKERHFVDFCRSPEFSLQRLTENLEQVYANGYYAEHRSSKKRRR